MDQSYDFMASYDVADANVKLNPITINVSGGRDLTGGLRPSAVQRPGRLQHRHAGPGAGLAVVVAVTNLTVVSDSNVGTDTLLVRLALRHADEDGRDPDDHVHAERVRHAALRRWTELVDQRHDLPGPVHRGGHEHSVYERRHRGHGGTTDRGISRRRTPASNTFTVDMVTPAALGDGVSVTPSALLVTTNGWGRTRSR